MDERLPDPNEIVSLPRFLSNLRISHPDAEPFSDPNTENSQSSLPRALDALGTGSLGNHPKRKFSFPGRVRLGGVCDVHGVETKQTG